MGKYSEFTGTLPKAESEYFHKVKAMKRQLIECGCTTLADAAARFEKNEEMITDLEDDVRDCKIIKEALEAIILDLFEKDGLTKAVTGAGVFSRMDVPQVKMENRGDFYAWLEANGMRDLFSVNINTANMVVKEALLAGKPLPPGTSISMRTTIRRTKK